MIRGRKKKNPAWWAFLRDCLDLAGGRHHLLAHRQHGGLKYRQPPKFSLRWVLRLQIVNLLAWDPAAALPETVVVGSRPNRLHFPIFCRRNIARPWHPPGFLACLSRWHWFLIHRTPAPKYVHRVSTARAVRPRPYCKLAGRRMPADVC